MAMRLINMEAAFDEATKQVLFKGSAIDAIKRIAIETVESLEQELARVRHALQAEIQVLEASEKACQAELKKTQAALAALQQKLAGVIEAGNAARKSAAARANRYKSKYEHLLDDIEQVLPGAKELLTSHAIAEADKVKKLQHLEQAIAKQKQRARDKVIYDAAKLRDVYLPGYGKQCRILHALLKRKQRLENQKSY